CLKICATTDHSAQLVGIADALGDPPFGLFHPLLALTFNIFNKRLSLSLSATRQLGSAIFNLSFFRSFQPPCSFLPSTVHAFPQTPNTQNLRQFKKDVSNSTTQDSIMNAHSRFNLLMRRSNVHSKFQVVTHHYQRISSSQYLLQMQVQAQPKCSNALTKRMIPYSHKGSQFKASKSNEMLTLLKRRTLCMLSPIGLLVFSNRHLFQLILDKNSLYKAFNGAECKCMCATFIARESILYIANHNEMQRVHILSMQLHMVSYSRTFIFVQL
ncbi:hypothetical protein H5410_061640, partial [Solanum commersonii]